MESLQPPRLQRNFSPGLRRGWKAPARQVTPQQAPHPPTRAPLKGRGPKLELQQQDPTGGEREGNR